MSNKKKVDKVPVYLSILVGTIIAVGLAPNFWSIFILFGGLAAFYIVPVLIGGVDVPLKQDPGYKK